MSGFGAYTVRYLYLFSIKGSVQRTIYYILRLISLQENLKPRPGRINLVTARLTWQGRGFRFSR